MSLEQLAREIAQSLARHQSRGLVDDAKGLADVVVHGRIDLVAVAEEVLQASIDEIRPVRRSWAGWFLCRRDARHRADRDRRALETLAERLEKASSEAEAAMIRLRYREMLSAGHSRLDRKIGDQGSS